MALSEKINILVVDDEQVIRDLFTKVLGKEGYEVVTAKNDSECLEVFRAGAFNLVMMDIKLSGTDGVKLLNNLKEMDPDIEGMIITGYASLESAIESLKNGASEYITKPFDRIEDVVRVVNRLVEKQKLTVENKKLQEETKKQRDELKKRVFELGVLYDVSDAIGYTLDYKELMRLIIDSLGKVIDYDLAASFFITPAGGEYILKPNRAITKDFMKHVTDNIAETITSLTGRTIGKDIKIDVLEMPLPEKDEKPPEKLNSFFNIPLIVKDKAVGMLNVSSARENAFGPDEIKLLYVISNQAAGAIQKLRGVIAAEKSKMDTMVESMTEGIIMTDHIGELVVINPAARQLLGFDLQQEITSAKLKNSFTDMGIAKLFGKGIGLEEEEEEEELKLDIRLQGPPVRILRASQSLVKDDEGKKLGYVTILRDVTKEREVDRMKSEFISTVSHELRTPLTSIKNVVTNILDGITGKINEKQKDYLHIANEEADRLSHIIGGLLDISRIEAGKIELRKTLVDITALANNAISLLKGGADEKRIRISTSYGKTQPDVFVDPERITQVFNNLIGNAIKFTPEKGRITVGVKDKKKELEVFVADTGIGIAPEDKDKVFERFAQIGRVSGAGEKGTGLGLPISKELIQLHGGNIWVESQFHKGSKFMFTLPKHGAETIFHEYLNNGIRKAKENHTVLSLIVLHITNFSNLKRRYGTKETHRMLDELEKVVKQTVRRPSDIVSRYRRGEIIDILAETDKKGAIVVEKRIKDALKGYKFNPAKDKPVELSITSGIATYPEEATTEEEIITKAEQKLRKERKSK